MKKILFLYIICFSFLSFQAQEWRPVYVSHWSYLFEKADLNSKKIGVMATEASVKLLDSAQNYYKILANNGDVGYIEKQKLTKSMRGKKDANEPQNYFYRGIQGFQCPHLFVQVSGLRSRTEPNTTSPVSKILPINQLECIEYVPFNKDAWVYIGDHFHKNPEYVQYKFLGKEISFQETLLSFENTNRNEAERQKILLERLVEIGWSSEPKNTLTALKLFKKFHQDQGTLMTVPDIDFELFLVENIQNQLSSQAKEKYNYHSILVNINNKEFQDGTIIESQIKMLKLKKINDYSQLPGYSECGWEPEFSYVNNTKKTVVNFEKQNNKATGLVEKLSFMEGNSVTIDQFRIDENTSEVDFIKKFGKLIRIDRFYAPGTYYLPDGDAGFMAISFKNRKAVSYQRFFYC